MTHLGDAKTRQEITRRVALLRPETPRRWGKMNAAQMLCHLDDSFKVAMGLKTASPATGPLQRTVMKWGALYVPIQWPKGYATRPEVEQGVGGTPPGNFADDRASLLATIAGFCDRNGGFAWQPHPFFGRMTERQWLRWGYLHTDHHLRQFGV
jgi:hypothetical protein